MSLKTKKQALEHYLSPKRECFAVPPHPDLKRRMDDLLIELKSNQHENFLFNKLTFAEEPKVGLDDGLIYPGTQFPLGTSMAPARSARSQQPPLRGVLNVLVVLVEFPDIPFATPSNHYEDLFFSTGVVPTGSVAEYYKEVTNGKISIQGDVIGPFMMPQPSTAYANGKSGMGSTKPNAQTMARDAAHALPPGTMISQYDNDKDGYVDAFIIIHSGTGAEVTNSPNQIWSHKWVIDGGPYTPPGNSVNIYSYLTVPEDCKLGVCAHELGHLLFGFPDLYDTSYRSAGIGDWCLMSGGSWNNGGDTPAHPCAWCKANQGWVTINIPKTNQTGVKIDDVKTGYTIKKLWKNGMPANEYFLLENRQLTNFDAYLPGGGLLIWHIDEAIPDNSNLHHYKVALMQADGLQELEYNRNSGDSGDLYTGAAGSNTTFDATSSPNSLSYGGVNSMVAVRNISASGNAIVCDIDVT